ncbi:unnamed protein product [Mytilus coruscus]|uniref:Tc1-like transposase DDE domain-containing protein n=1 Tax=Mytilus coruscus TaxID=42192 RepID=A0A6J8CL33_MYTCO|nr:unnamed protein product [Mytilus coruscus]
MDRKGKELSPDLKSIAVDLFRNGEKISDIARILQKPRSTISGIIRRFQDAGTIENRPRSGRPRAMLDRDYRQLEKFYQGVGTLTKVEGYINADKYISILDDNIWPVIARHFPTNDYLFQDDNAPVHRARSTKAYIARTHLQNMSWPAQSPDLNIIENVWLYIKRKLQVLGYRINSKDELYRKVFQIWQSIPLNYIRSLYNSIPRRILHVIKLKGHLTKY